MNADARTDHLPMPALTRPPLGQPRVPCERRRHTPAIAQLDDERVIGDLNVYGRRGFRCQT